MLSNYLPIFFYAAQISTNSIHVLYIVFAWNGHHFTSLQRNNFSLHFRIKSECENGLSYCGEKSQEVGKILVLSAKTTTHQ